MVCVHTHARAHTRTHTHAHTHTHTPTYIYIKDDSFCGLMVVFLLFLPWFYEKMLLGYENIPISIYTLHVCEGWSKTQNMGKEVKADGVF